MCYKRSHYRSDYTSHRRHRRGRWGGHRPPVNIDEQEDSFELHLFAPGLDKDGLKIWVKNDHLHITYRAPREEEDEIVSHYKRYREHRHPDFERSFDLNKKVQVEQITATYTDGVLKMVLPKDPDTNPPVHTIEVQ